MAFADPKKHVEQFALSRGQVVADFGVGAGYLAVEAAEQVGSEGKVYVIDIQQDLLTKVQHLAQEHHLKIIQYVHGDLERPRGSTLPDASVDAVIVSNILFQVEDKRAVLIEAVRILKNGGRVLLIDWSGSFGGMGPLAEHVFSEETARALAEDVGLVFEASIDAGSYHHGSTFIKHG